MNQDLVMWHSCTWNITIIVELFVQMVFVAYAPQKLIDERVDIQKSLLQKETFSCKVSVEYIFLQDVIVAVFSC